MIIDLLVCQNGRFTLEAIRNTDTTEMSIVTEWSPSASSDLPRVREEAVFPTVGHDLGGRTLRMGTMTVGAMGKTSPHPLPAFIPFVRGLVPYTSGRGNRQGRLADQFKICADVENSKRRKKGGYGLVCWLLACLTSQQHASVSQGRICSESLLVTTLRSRRSK